MTTHRFQMTPGKLLHDAIMGAMVGRGLSAATHCAAEGITYPTMRLATFGISGGARGDELRERAIDVAGRDMVEHLYFRMVIEEADRIRAVAA